MKRSLIEGIIEDWKHPDIDILLLTVQFQPKDKQDGLLLRHYQHALVNDSIESWKYQLLSCRREWAEYYGRSKLTRNNLNYKIKWLVEKKILEEITEKEVVVKNKNKIEIEIIPLKDHKYRIHSELQKEIGSLMKKAGIINKIRESPCDINNINEEFIKKRKLSIQTGLPVL
jgi:hypothetical protein